VHLLAAPDKFRDTLSAPAAAAAIAAGAARAGWTCSELPLADGGEATLDVFGGGNRTQVVSGPLGEPLEAPWRLDGDAAVIEMARASGLVLAGGRAGNDPLRATTRGTGELIEAAIRAGATRIIVGVGGSATTDGGLGAVEALGWRRFAERNVTVRVACDVGTRFVDAATVFGPQKGADATQVDVLADRLRQLAARYREQLDVDVTGLPRGGAAGGLAGGLAALGAQLVDGFDLIADAAGLDEALGEAQLVVTGEGLLDATSFEGKVVGGVARRATEHGVPVLAICGDVAPGARDRITAVSLVERYGSERAWREAAACLADATWSTLDEAPHTHPTR
jgi:glycerate kinase